MASTSAFVAALLQAVANASVNRLPAEEKELSAWLGGAPDNPIPLAFQSLQDRFSLRRWLLAAGSDHRHC